LAKHVGQNGEKMSGISDIVIFGCEEKCAPDIFEVEEDFFLSHFPPN
jgi:hypothetical protein